MQTKVEITNKLGSKSLLSKLSETTCRLVHDGKCDFVAIKDIDKDDDTIYELYTIANDDKIKSFFKKCILFKRKDGKKFSPLDLIYSYITTKPSIALGLGYDSKGTNIQYYKIDKYVICYVNLIDKK